MQATVLTSELLFNALHGASTQGKDKVWKDCSVFLASNFYKYDINSYLRICHFLAQALEETDSGHTLVEYASGNEYEGRADLGNTHPGDGVRFKGRGIFQYTGRFNYQKISTTLNVDFISHPELLAQPEYAVLSAFEYWNSHNLSTYADQDDILTITRRINGGTNGLSDRKLYLSRVKNLLPKDVVVLTNVPTPPPTPTPVPSDVITGKPGDTGPGIVVLKGLFRALGADVDDSPLYDDKLTNAVKLFQSYVNLPVTGIVDRDTWNTLQGGVSV